MIVEVLLTLLVAGALIVGMIKLIAYLFPRSPSKPPRSGRAATRRKQARFSCRRL